MDYLFIILRTIKVFEIIKGTEERFNITRGIKYLVKRCNERVISILQFVTYNLYREQRRERYRRVCCFIAHFRRRCCINDSDRITLLLKWEVRSQLQLPISMVIKLVSMPLWTTDRMKVYTVSMFNATSLLPSYIISTLIKVIIIVINSNKNF